MRNCAFQFSNARGTLNFSRSPLMGPVCKCQQYILQKIWYILRRFSRLAWIVKPRDFAGLWHCFIVTLWYCYVVTYEMITNCFNTGWNNYGFFFNTNRCWKIAFLLKNYLFHGSWWWCLKFVSRFPCISKGILMNLLLLIWVVGVVLPRWWCVWRK